MHILSMILFGFATLLNYGDAASLSKPFTLSSAMQDYILGLHNNFRSSVAKGQTGSQPSGADVQKMTWDPNLAAYAQSNTDKCDFTHSARIVSGYSGKVGENMAAGQLLEPISTDADLQAAFNVQFQPSEYPGIDTWTDEHTHFTYPKCQAGQVCGHYTQLVWANSNKVGCAISQCNGLDGGWYNPEDQLTNLILCNYYPAGNMQIWVNNTLTMPPPYKSGSTCSACPTTAKTCSTDGLCTV
jgi:hypothetical protein